MTRRRFPYYFVYDTALKMYPGELGGKSLMEFPPRFHKMITKEALFEDQPGFAISEEQ